eukprot:11922087-Alexandrium_andersonii.AAC.1
MDAQSDAGSDVVAEPAVLNVARLRGDVASGLVHFIGRTMQQARLRFLCAVVVASSSARASPVARGVLSRG